ncbi:O-antigen ligase family protein [Bacteroides sp.]|uniref:O-antigen ligase family protein n=1 Tax=Bacteroides sp. TaxID=29523 RepID=UPI0023C7E7C3|nr:O-antigen ligase family protein [Bacteroides sp.]MDE6215116.1 O-antigen ligase family protein [Bacteroides sp.]
MDKLKYILSAVLQGMGIAAMLALPLVSDPTLPAGETAGQWVGFDRGAIVAAAGILLGLLVSFRLAVGKRALSVAGAVGGSLMLLGGVQAALGLLQLYGYAASRHSLYAMTGSFFNPGPYSGYLAMVLPICLHRWLADEGLKKRVSGAVALLILCVLPAGMSRSAWVAAAVSCLWVYGCRAGWQEKIRCWWQAHRRQVPVLVAGGGCLLVLAGFLLFTLKPDSARGRLFMWRMSCLAIAEKPLTGHGAGSFAAAYGDAQEAYFAAGGFEPWEERVAGSPEYAFNEYLQAAVELGIPLALCLTGIVVGCLYAGMRKGRYGICGALLSLMIFSLSSYPLQLPAFIVTLAGLLAACVSGNGRREWLVAALLAGCIGGFRLRSDVRTEQSCCEWTNARVLYHAGAYQSAEKEYERLHSRLGGRAAFLFEYGHGLHKQQKYAASNRILKEALKHSSDPMILNIIGKNHQAMGDYRAAEAWFLRSTHRLPGRIYPYYLLAKLYWEPGFYQPDRLEEMKRMVLTKEPKVHSTAIRQMREEVEKMK